MAESSLLFDAHGVKIIERNGAFLIRYDAGSHQVEIREDGITSLDVVAIQRNGNDAVDAVLRRLQGDLLKQGLNPFISNLSSNQRSP